MEENMEEGQTQKGTGLHGVAPSSASVLPLPPSGFRLLPGGCQGGGQGVALRPGRWVPLSPGLVAMIARLGAGRWQVAGMSAWPWGRGLSFRPEL